MDYNLIYKKFPKSRKPLSNEYLRIYEEHYKDNREGKGLFNFLSSGMESWAHKIISKKKNLKKSKILEVGAGTLNHLKYEKSFSEYDIVEPFKKLLMTTQKKKNKRYL